MESSPSSSKIAFIKATPTIQFYVDDEESSDNNASSKEPPFMHVIGYEAVWSLSITKLGSGVDQVRIYRRIPTGRTVRKTALDQYPILMTDESYAPKRLGVWVGMT